MTFSTDGKKLLTYGIDGTAREWDTSTGRLLYALSQ